MISKDRIQADILDRALQWMLEGNAAVADSARGDEGAASEVRLLLETAGRVRELLPTRGPSPEFIAATETRLLRRIKASVPQSARRESRMAGQARSSWLRSAAFATAITLVVVFASGLSVTSASAKALPGDVLYPVKQGLEEISLMMSQSPAGDVDLLADFVDERLEEVIALAAKDREADLVSGLENYDKTLSRLDAAMDQLPPDSESVQLEEIQARLARHTDMLLVLRGQLPEQAQTALDRAVDHSQKSRDRVEKLEEDRGPDGVPPGQEKKSTKEADEGNGGPPSTKKTPDTASKTPKSTNTPKYTKTPKPTKPLK
jgi:hypothetical protein